MKAERSRNRGVTLIATLVVLILHAGFAGVLQARAMASVQVGAAVVHGLEDETNLASVRAILLPEIVEALLVVQEGETPEFRLDGTMNMLSHGVAEYGVAVSPLRSSFSWQISIREAASLNQ